jgi:hypothetical protein
VRFALLLLPSLAFAEARLDVHVGGGAEAGTMMKDDHPVLASEVGVSAHVIPKGKTWGLGFMLERVERQEVGIDITEELKLDVMLRVVAKKDFRFGVGMGIRELGVPGDARTPPSTVWGLDLMRMCTELQLAKLGRVGIDAYFSWTLGLYKGEVFNARYGDMPYTKRDYFSVTNTYIVGISTSVSWD